jgi:DNA-binding SARP family transcriptional activator
MEEALRWEPFRESLYRLLMRAHAGAGNRAEALRAYERCRRLLADELGVGPPPETEALYLDIVRSI